MSARVAIILWALVLAVPLWSACSSEPETAGEDVQATSGGDDGWDETDGWAKPMPQAAKGGAEQAGESEPQPAAEPQDFRPKVPDVRQIATAEPVAAEPTGSNEWGAPDAACSRPLPKRPKMNSAATQALQQGMGAAQRGDNASAKSAFEKALAADARAFEAAYNLGVALDRLGQTSAALQSYARSLKIQPDYERAVWGTVNIYVRQGSAAQAVSFAEPIARRYDCNLYLQAILADALTEAGRLDEAEAAARGALRRDERFVPAMVALTKSSLKRGRAELAESILEQAKAIDKNDPEIHFLQGKAQQEEGLLAQALASYRRAVEIRPSYAEARMALGIQYMAGGNYAQAQQEFEAVTRLMPGLVAARLNLGDAYRANKNWKAAKRELDTALRMQPGLAEAHFNLGLLFMTARDEYPGLDTLGALQRAALEFNNYRSKMGPRMAKDDPSIGFSADIDRQLDRERKRIEREKARKQREADRAARKQEMEGAQ